MMVWERLWPSARTGVLVALAGLTLLMTASAAPAAGPTQADKRQALAQLAADSRTRVAPRSEPGARFPHFVEGRIPVRAFSAGDTARERSDDFVDAYGAALGVDDAARELVFDSRRRDRLGMDHVRYEQRYRGLSVEGRELLVHLDEGAVVAVNGEFTPVDGVRTNPDVSAVAAVDAARGSLLKLDAGRPARRPELLLHVDALERARLAWVVVVPTARPLGLWRVFVDARTGAILSSYDDLHTALDRAVHDNGNDPDCNRLGPPACTLPGELGRGEGQPATGEKVVDAAYDNAGRVHDYYSQTFGRDSYDGAGHPLRSTVHFGAGYSNAFWCSETCPPGYGSANGDQAVYGDGNGSSVGSFGADLDTTAHEITHGLTEKTAGLRYVGQSGALNESYSDVFAAMIDDDDWLIGEDVITPGTPGGALRDMANPDAHGQPRDMAGYFHTIYDSAGVHTNSGIPNRAAYLTATDPGYGVGRADTARIYYRALSTYLTPTSGFVANLDALRRSAADLFGAGSRQERAIVRAQAAVGLASPPTIVALNGGETLRGGREEAVRWDTRGETGLAHRVEYLQESVSTTYEQGFEGDALPGEFATFNTPWTITPTNSRTGGGSARSGVIGSRGRSGLSLTRTLAEPGTLEFSVRISSEERFDYFSFYVDGEHFDFNSGQDLAYRRVSVPLSAGTHSFTWLYQKDGADPPDATLVGEDLAQIDDLRLPGVEAAEGVEVAAAAAPGMTSVPWTPPAVATMNARLRVTALGLAPWLASDASNGTLTIDPQAPAAVVSAGPSTVTSERAPTFLFTADEPDVRFECGLDGAAPGPCSAPYTAAPLADGPHVLEVVAFDAAGAGPPARRAFTVDTAAPTAAFVDGPSGPTRIRAPRFAFSTGEAGALAECRLDDLSFGACGSPFQTPALADGLHVVVLRARDEAGNTGPDVTRAFLVDTRPPRVTAATIRRRALVRYRASEPGTVTARLQRLLPRRRTANAGVIVRRAQVGANQLSLRRAGRTLRRGRYRVTLVATDAAGNRSTPKRLQLTV